MTLPAVSYQPFEFGASQIIEARSSHLNERTGQYLVACFKKQMSQFSYSKKPGIAIYKNMELELPYIRRTVPDWNVLASLIDVWGGVLDMSNIDTSSWQEFRIGDLFSIETPKKKLNAYEVEFGGSHPYVVRTASDNGIRGYINADEAWLNDAGTIAFGQDTGTIFYQPEPYFTGDKIKIMRLQDAELTESIALYLIAAMKRGFAGFSWGQSSFNVSVLENVKISLPAKVVDEPDWAYMEEYIKQLEAERIEHLEAYLIAADLNDYELTDKDKRVLSQTKAMAEFRVGDLFDIIKGKRLTKADMIPGEIAFIGSTQINNGLTARVGNPGHVHPAGTITVTYNGSVGQVFYQTEPFRVSDDVNVLYPKFDTDECIALYCCAALRRAGKIYTYTHKWAKDKMSDDLIYLPVADSGQPDFAYMAAYIRAQQKLAIADVVRLKDRIIAETKHVVAR